MRQNNSDSTWSTIVTTAQLQNTMPRKGMGVCKGQKVREDICHQHRHELLLQPLQSVAGITAMTVPVITIAIPVLGSDNEKPEYGHGPSVQDLCRSGEQCRQGFVFLSPI